MGKNRVITTCYHCGNTGTLDHKATVTWQNAEIEHGSRGVFLSGYLIEHIDWNLYECPVCNNPTLIRDYVFDAGSYGDYVDHELTTVFPSVLVNKTGVPTEIANAFDAAVKTKGIDPAICLLSLRRVLEMIARNMDAIGVTLEKKIEFLVEKKALPDMLNDACWIIRKMGNAAAHADDIKVYAYDVDKVIEYVAVIIEYLYSLPKRIKDAKAKIEQEG